MLGNLGGLGLLGTGGGGIGLGTGKLGPGGAPMTAPTIRELPISVSGRLPPEIIQRIARQNFGRFRMCYQAALNGMPTLAGEVRTRFVIDAKGAVASSNDAGSSMPDAGVVACVNRAFQGLSFPAPESGIVTVVYALSFTP
jgi:hypothetical protein